jgi:cell shape-determining protein MreD
MAALVSIPVLALALIIQTAILSRINLLSGSADLILLIVAGWGLQVRSRSAWVWAALAGLLVGYVSALPMFVPVAGYLLTMAVARLLQRRIWQAPLLAMFAVTFAGTLAMQLITYVTLWLLGSPLPLGDSFSQIILPSILLNLLLSIPLHALMRDLARWLHPREAEA